MADGMQQMGLSLARLRMDIERVERGCAWMRQGFGGVSGDLIGVLTGSTSSTEASAVIEYRSTGAPAVSILTVRTCGSMARQACVRRSV
jgi:hypothetical protein